MEEQNAAALGDRIVKATRKLLRRQGKQWVTLTDLRAQLPNVSPFAVDRTLLALHRAGRIELVQEADQRALTMYDRMNAVQIAGRARHLIGLPSG